MTQIEFEQIVNGHNWEIIVWNKYNAYKISGRSQDKSFFSVETFDRSDYQKITIDNCHEFEVTFSGEMQAVYHLIRKAIIGEISDRLGGSL